MIELKNVSIKYHNMFNSLTNVNLNLTKSTQVVGDELFTSAFCRVLMNFDKYDGEVLIDGINTKRIKNKDYPIAFVPKQDVLFNNWTARNNILYSLEIRKFSKEEQDNAINSLISTCKLDFLDKKAKYLTPAERKLTALLRAIIHKPKYLLIENMFDYEFGEYTDTITKLIASIDNVIITTDKELNQFCSFKIISIV